MSVESSHPDVAGQVAVSVAQACSMLGISKSLAYEAVALGEIPSLRIGRRILIPVRAIEGLVASAVPKNSSQL